MKIKFTKKLNLFSNPTIVCLGVTIFIILCVVIFEIGINEFLISTTGPFFGAGAAFIFNIYYDKKSEKNKNKSALIKSRYAIDKISSFHKQLKCHINENTNLTNKELFEWEKIPEYDPSSYLPEIETKDLLFLLKCKDKGEDTLNSILLVYAENSTLQNVLKERNEMYSFYLNKTEGRDSIQKSQLEKIIGARLFKRLEMYTRRLIDTNNDLLEDCEKSKFNINNFIENF